MDTTQTKIQMECEKISHQTYTLKGRRKLFIHQTLKKRKTITINEEAIIILFLMVMGMVE